ncbi:MAG: hypothetical protein ACI867_000860 [Glaciecola sp.]|jgi:hypothetical protein
MPNVHRKPFHLHGAPPVRTRTLLHLVAAGTAVLSVTAAMTTSPAQLDDAFHQDGFARQVAHERPETEGDFLDFEHVANIDLSAFQALAVDENGNAFGADSGMGTFMDFASYEVGEEGLRDFAFLGSDFDGTFIIDITNPQEPDLRGHIPCRYEQNEVGFVNGLDFPVLAIGNQGGPSCVPRSYELDVNNLGDGPIGLGGRQASEVLSFWDVSNPDEPTFLSAYADTITDGAHTIAAHPSLPVVIPVGGSQERLVFVDVSDPRAPSVLTMIDTPGTTHKAHWSPDGSRLGTAGGVVEAIAIFDTSDVANPVLEATTAAPGQTYQHEVHPFTQVDPITGIERQLHIASEENLGGPFAGYCSSTGFFIFEQVGPVLTPLSFSTAGFTAGTSTVREGENEYCTAHYGSVSHDGFAYTIPWYIAGLYVFDLANLAAPSEVAHAVFPDSNVWSAKTYRGNYVYTGDLFRGFDVFEYTGDLDLAQLAGDADQPESL